MLKCGLCAAELGIANICVFDVDGADQCEDGRFESPTYSLTIKCHACRKELLRLEHANSDYGEREQKPRNSRGAQSRADPDR
jgi:hypothetical protein